jgi:ABC-type transport system involved in multi-copper enzyme maturation permease subunit
VTALLASEVRRLTSRRLVRIMLLASVVLVLVVDLLVTIFRNPDRLGESMRTVEIWLTPGMARHLGVQRGELILPTIAVLTYLLVIVIGASAVGAEYRAGTVTTVLTWSPRRVRLMVGRYLAIALVAMGFFLVVQLVFVAGWHLGATVNGTTAGADADFWRELASVLVRSTLVAGGLAVVSAALATLLRNTAGAMGIWFGYLVVVEGIVRANFSDLVPWFLTGNIAAAFGWETVRSDGHSIGPEAGLLRLVLYLLLIGAGSIAVFRSRDVT